MKQNYFICLMILCILLLAFSGCGKKGENPIQNTDGIVQNESQKPVVMPSDDDINNYYKEQKNPMNRQISMK